MLHRCYTSCTFVNFHFNFASVVVWRGRDGAQFPLSLPNLSKNKGGRTGEQGKVGFHHKPPKSIKKALAADGAQNYNGCIEEKGPLWEFWRQRWPSVSQIRNPLGKPMVQHNVTKRKNQHLHVQTASWRN